MTFSQKNQKCIRQLQSLFHNSSHRIRESITFPSVRNFWGCTNEDENFMKRIITSDETRVYGYDMETKMQSSQGVEKICWDQKKHGRLGQTWKPCWRSFLTSRVLCITNSYLRYKWWIADIISKCWNIWEKMSGEKGPSCGETTPGSSIKTMCQLKHGCWLVTFWIKWTQLRFPSHLTHPTCPRQTFSYSLNWNPL